ncbi:hypothetical protein TrLO_g7659, partial [Triparma laevis f. longispina]
MSSPFRPASSAPVSPPPQEAEPEEEVTTLENVKYGDQVFFQMSQPKNGFMHVDKVFSRVGFQTAADGSDVLNFDECLFVVTPMLNYDSKQQAAVLKRTASKLSGGDDEANGEQAMLQARLKQENDQNKKLLMKCDKPPGDGTDELRYGQVIQLKHISTGKFLSGNSITAKVEKSCLRLSLSDGDDNCHFKLMPRFKVRHEGSPAYFTDLLILQSVALDGYSLHVSGKPYDKEE